VLTMDPPMGPGNPETRIDIALHPTQSAFMKRAS